MNRFALRLTFVALVLAGCATAQTGSPAADVTGRWAGDVVVPRRSPAPVTMTLSQKDAKVSGEVTAVGFPLASGPITGTVSGDTFTFSYVNVTGGGKLTVKGDQMEGLTDNGNRMVVRRQR